MKKEITKCLKNRTSKIKTWKEAVKSFRKAAKKSKTVTISLQ